LRPRQVEGERRQRPGRGCDLCAATSLGQWFLSEIGNVLGPWIVTPDEIGDPYRLKMEARVNGEVRSQGTTEGMLFSFEQIIARISQDETLMHGESIGSGTVGNECGLELGWFLEHGDCVELEVERSGC
jgi:2-keto-4-pentenoate hydratase/2-oxohepta-3-ene-1,7-dioic acid hydratase in catechol pathway